MLKRREGSTPSIRNEVTVMKNRYLTARMSMLDEPDRVWKFKNPWNKPSYRIRRFVLENKIILPLICKFTSSRANNYWQMKLVCKRIGLWK